jgi:hypothetical protein
LAEQFPVTFAWLLRQLRVDAGLTQEELGTALQAWVNIHDAGLTHQDAFSDEPAKYLRQVPLADHRIKPAASKPGTSRSS